MTTRLVQTFARAAWYLWATPGTRPIATPPSEQSRTLAPMRSRSARVALLTKAGTSGSGTKQRTAAGIAGSPVGAGPNKIVRISLHRGIPLAPTLISRLSASVFASRPSFPNPPPPSSSLAAWQDSQRHDGGAYFSRGQNRRTAKRSGPVAVGAFLVLGGGGFPEAARPCVR